MTQTPQPVRPPIGKEDFGPVLGKLTAQASWAQGPPGVAAMKEVLGLSLGDSERDFEATVELGDTMALHR